MRAMSEASFVRILRALVLVSALALAEFIAPRLKAQELGTSTRSNITVHFKLPAWGSVGLQYVNASLLHSLLWKVAARLPGFGSCELEGAYFEAYADFVVGVSHPSPARRLECLRAAVRYLQQDPISEADFLAVRRFRVESEGWSLEPRARDWGRVEQAASTLAYLSIYEKDAPVYGIFAARIAGFADTSFDDFDLWLRRMREEKLISFEGSNSLLRLLDLPVRDRMVVAPYSYLPTEEPRVAAGTLFFDGERFGVDALVMIVISHDWSDPKLLDRLACNTRRPANLGGDVATSAFFRVSCDTIGSYGGPWFRFAITKSDDATYEEFCRQARDIVRAADIANVVRFSPEGSKGLYVLLPPKCKAEQ